MSVVEAKPKLKRSDLIWTLIGLCAVVLSGVLLYRELRTISLDEIKGSLEAISHLNWALAAVATLGAYGHWPGMTASPSRTWASRFPGASSPCAPSPPTRWPTTSAPRCSPARWCVIAPTAARA